MEANPFRRASLCVVGNINRDVKVLGVPGSAALLRDGETSVPPIVETIGGGGANSACAAAALGGKVQFAGKIGSDALGKRLRETMERQGVRTFLRTRRDCSTGSTVALGLDSGHRHFLSCLPNNEGLRFADLDLKALNGCEHLLRADVWFSRDMLESGNERLLRTARSRGMRTSLDINFDPAWSRARRSVIRQRKQLLRKVLPLVDLAHGNVAELCEFADATRLDDALKRLASWGAGAVVVHLGAKGAGFFSRSEWVVEPANVARRSVHSTGTGDVLSMCMILLEANRSLSIRQKLRLSNRLVREFMEGKRDLIPSLP